MEEMLKFAKSINKIDENKYFVFLKDNINRNNILENFMMSQVNFVDAVDEWSCILGLMVAKVPSVKERIVLIKNLYDEHGNGNIENSHVVTFNKFIKMLLEICNNRIELIHDDRINNEIINKFIHELHNVIGSNNWVYSIAVLAMIEYTYITVSKCIHEFVSNYTPSELIHHYSLHEIMDQTHSQELFSIVTDQYETKNNKKVIEDGILHGYKILYDLYDSLFVFFATTT
ncbi:MAG: heme oxygenase [Edafosvirus sp.]|uniref:Heme oxygenase n=1 Tax=Edafosvirus sp. TaxID=2487765 RepID=A0A3G4ZUJ4_9VIRU|nr:MAG: heme oxygenase [Edafosvirus sp.]